MNLKRYWYSLLKRTIQITYEQFPSFLPSRKLSTKSKSKSLTEAEISGDMAGVQDLATVVERLRNEEPPLSLEQVRDRRASIKKQRKESISLIRSRTASRASNGGRPSMEAMENGKRIG